MTFTPLRAFIFLLSLFFKVILIKLSQLHLFRLTGEVEVSQMRCELYLVERLTLWLGGNAE